MRIGKLRIYGNPKMQIHFCVLLWGFTAILGRLITLPALPLVWWRMVSVSAVLLVVPWVWKQLRKMSARLVAGYSAAGALLSLHWLTFYGSVKLANASVAATCMALTTVLLALVEPLANRRSLNLPEISLGAATVPGVLLVIGAVPQEMGTGVLLGVLSAVLLAGLGILNKRLVDQAHPVTITALEFAAGAILLSILALAISGSRSTFAIPDMYDTFLLLVLVFGCTILPFIISFAALRYISAFYAQLAINLEPLYVVLIAAILLGEHRTLGWSFYLGTAIMVGAVLVHPLLAARSKHRRAQADALRDSHRESNPTV
ncbi:MAG TPA: EamA family transporter [Micromonosporaceae bacterium]|nr:EamA family transporter [Micromonosporaceae bacterium]HCU50638.1 EamA family transporter [Micromonosporaceae bacterium]